MSIKQFIRIPLTMKQILSLPPEELRDFDLYVQQDIVSFEDDTLFYLDDSPAVYLDTNQEVYPAFALKHNLKWFENGFIVAEEYIVVDSSQTLDVNASMENYIYFGTMKSVTFKFPQVEITDELPYIVAMDFSVYLLNLYQNNETSELADGLNFIEHLHHSQHHKVKELATIGYLEAIQNIWGNHGVDPEAIFEYLGVESKKWWIELRKFWRGEIKYVGETYE